jgi:hypothetical protein
MGRVKPLLALALALAGSIPAHADCEAIGRSLAGFAADLRCTASARLLVE